MGVAQAHRPVLDRDPDRRGVGRAGTAPGGIPPAPSPDIGPGVRWMPQDLQHPEAVGRHPDHLVRCRPAHRPHRQHHAMALQVAHHGPGVLQFPEPGEHQAQPRLHLLVRVEDDGAVAVVGETGRQREAELSPRRFLPLALMQARPDLVQLRLAHEAREAQQKAVVVTAGVVQALAVGEDHPEERAQLQQLVPVAVVAGQPRCVQAEHQARLAQPDLRHQPLEALPLQAGRAGLAEVVVDHRDPFARPAEPGSPLDQAVLQFGALLVLADLPGRGLADVDIGELGAMRGGDPLGGLIRDGQHDAPPRAACAPARGRRAGPVARALSWAASAMAAVGVVAPTVVAAGGPGEGSVSA